MANRLDNRSLADCVADRGEVLVARSNTEELVGRAAYFPGTDSPTYVADLLMRIKCGDSLDEEFASFFFSYLYTTGYWQERAGGASGTMKKIRREQLLAVRIPVIDKTAQRSVAKRVKANLMAGQTVVAHLSSRLAELDRLPAALLRSAFRD